MRTYLLSGLGADVARLQQTMRAPARGPRCDQRGPGRSAIARAANVVALFLVVSLANAAGLTPAAAEELRLGKSEWQAIQSVISWQLTALRAGDGERAFEYASPGIRAQFGDAQTFMSMVRGAYSALLVARYTEFLEGAVIDGLVIQPVQLIAPDNTVLVALYTLEKRKDGWRISGCRLAPSTVQAA